ncbi:hypothetical protein EVA_07913 [gut metagenome]|uniref:Uncharacterized protein n=1 Tax=gut metagenome TaxID=749906 RepID=J9GU84_9ZZZZ
MNGCPSKGCSSERGISCTRSCCSSIRDCSVEKISSYPFKLMFTPFFCMIHHLLRQNPVCFCYFALWVMLKNTVSFCTDLLSTDRTWNIRLINLQSATITLTNQIADVFGIIGPAVYHRQKDTFDFKLRIDLPFDLVNGFKELFQTFCRQISCLDRNQYIISRSQGIYCQHSERRHTIQQNKIIILFDGIQILPENGFSAHCIDERDLQPGQFDIGRNIIHTFRMMQNTFSGSNRFICNNLAHQIGKSGREFIRKRISHTDRKGCLRICVYQKNFLALHSQSNTQVLTGRCLACATFLVYDSNDIRFL